MKNDSSATIQIKKSGYFTKWFRNLKDIRAKSRIALRIDAAKHGHFGDCKPVGNGISEMRIFTGKGYRVYYIQHDSIIYVLLNGGNKDTQKGDIQKAKRIAQEMGLL